MFPLWLCMSAALNSSFNHLMLQIWLHRISNGPESRYLKVSFRGRAFEDDEAVIMAINKRTEEQDQNFFCEGVTTLQQR